MFWSRTQTSKLPLEAASVPHSQALLQAALQASWKRDRRVGGRRLALRWVVWAFLRYGPPFLLPLAVAMSVWFWLLPSLQDSTVNQAIVSPPAATTPLQAQPAPATEPPDAITTTTIDTKIVTTADGLALRLERSLSSSSIPLGGKNPPPTAVKPVNNPSLKPENWLNSKEP
jgi:hypothetical protein